MEEKTKLHPELKFLLFITPIAFALAPFIHHWIAGDPMRWLQ